MAVDHLAVSSSAVPAHRRRAFEVTALIATAGVVAALVGVAVLAIPVRSPLQDCGSPFAFLYDGRTDVTGDPARPPEGASPADVKATNARPCRPRVADRARPAAALLGVGTTFALGATVTETVIRWRARRRSNRRPPVGSLAADAQDPARE